MNNSFTLSPDKGSYQPGDTVRLTVESTAIGDFALECVIRHLHMELQRIAIPSAAFTTDRHRYQLEWTPPPTAMHGYGADLTVSSPDGTIISRTSTSFDVLSSWTQYPRYGFVTDFTPGRNDAAETMEELARFHINGLQFYDWQYRHDDLVAPTAEFDDPLDRRLSLITIRELADAAHSRGMAAMAYVAVYAASPEFWRSNPESALYDDAGQAVSFMDDFLGLMDPTADSTWANHLLGECDTTLASLEFDGIHIDQYGEPRTAWNHNGEPVDLPQAFGDFVRELKRRHPKRPTTFNAVKNWPIDALVGSPMDFVYIELWPETPSYRELAEVVRSAHAESGGKPAVIALYLPADRPINIRLANALIISNGGSRIEIGEHSRLLSDPYFPLHQELDPATRDTVLRYSDFRVRYGDLLGPASASTDSAVRLPEEIWATTRTSPGWSLVSMVNMSGIAEAHWDESHSPPRPQHNVIVEVDVTGPVREVWHASPDNDGRMRSTSWTREEDTLRVTVPSIDTWTMLMIEAASERKGGRLESS